MIEHRASADAERLEFGLEFIEWLDRWLARVNRELPAIANSPQVAPTVVNHSDDIVAERSAHFIALVLFN